MLGGDLGSEIDAEAGKTTGSLVHPVEEHWEHQCHSDFMSFVQATFPVWSDDLGSKAMVTTFSPLSTQVMKRVLSASSSTKKAASIGGAEKDSSAMESAAAGFNLENATLLALHETTSEREFVLSVP
jgi:hypothetical protein